MRSRRPDTFLSSLAVLIGGVWLMVGLMLAAMLLAGGYPGEPGRALTMPQQVALGLALIVVAGAGWYAAVRLRERLRKPPHPPGDARGFPIQPKSDEP